ncbi:hypothetical protein LCL61_31205 [Amycolatopsis coloradensis]|uniref:Uncharacterized protein n=1 Tax=Amycolatopsis coloradensis TaxID=76021 RepID=A0ACD5BKZ2_9PSEU
MDTNVDRRRLPGLGTVAVAGAVLGAAQIGQAAEESESDTPARSRS